MQNSTTNNASTSKMRHWFTKLTLDQKIVLARKLDVAMKTLYNWSDKPGQVPYDKLKIVAEFMASTWGLDITVEKLTENIVL